MEKEIKEIMEFVRMARKTCIEPDKVYEFSCPICGAVARASKHSSNGHHAGRCDGCKFRFME